MERRDVVLAHWVSSTKLKEKSQTLNRWNPSFIRQSTLSEIG